MVRFPVNLNGALFPFSLNNGFNRYLMGVFIFAAGLADLFIGLFIAKYARAWEGRTRTGGYILSMMLTLSAGLLIWFGLILTGYAQL